MTLYISSYLAATQILTFGYIKWNPDVVFTGSLFDIVFGQYFRQWMGEKTATKNAEWNQTQIIYTVMYINGGANLLQYIFEKEPTKTAKKSYPDVVFTGSFPNIVFSQYFSSGMDKKTASKNVEWVRHC